MESGIPHALVGDKSSEIPVTKYEYKCDFICVFFLFSTLVTREPFFLPPTFPFSLFYTQFPCLFLFSDPSENQTPSFPSEEVYSVELARFLETIFPAINLLNLEFWDCELTRMWVRVEGSLFSKGRSSSEQSFSLSWFMQEDSSVKIQLSQTSSYPSSSIRKGVGRRLTACSYFFEGVKLLSRVLGVSWPIPQRLKRRSEEECSWMKRFQRQKLTLEPLTIFQFWMKYQSGGATTDSVTLCQLLLGGRVSLFREITNSVPEDITYFLLLYKMLNN